MSTKKFRVRLAAIAMSLGLVVAVSAPASAATKSGHVTCGYVYAASLYGKASLPASYYIGHISSYVPVYPGGAYTIFYAHSGETSAYWGVSASTIYYAYATCD